jgi:hypothetical protein
VNLKKESINEGSRVAVAHPAESWVGTTTECAGVNAVWAMCALLANILEDVVHN